MTSHREDPDYPGYCWCGKVWTTREACEMRQRRKYMNRTFKIIEGNHAGEPCIIMDDYGDQGMQVKLKGDQTTGQIVMVSRKRLEEVL